MNEHSDRWCPRNTVVLMNTPAVDLTILDEQLESELDLEISRSAANVVHHAEKETASGEMALELSSGPATRRSLCQGKQSQELTPSFIAEIPEASVRATNGGPPPVSPESEECDAESGTEHSAPRLR